MSALAAPDTFQKGPPKGGVKGGLAALINSGKVIDTGKKGGPKGGPKGDGKGDKKGGKKGDTKGDAKGDAKGDGSGFVRSAKVPTLRNPQNPGQTVFPLPVLA